MRQVKAETINLLPTPDYSSIYTPGAIQPHGILFALQLPELTILKVSQNTDLYFETPANELIGRSLETILTRSQIEDIQQGFAENLGTLNPINLSIRNQDFKAIVHRSETTAILELESIYTSPSDPHTLTRKAVAKLQKTRTLDELLQQVVVEVHQLTGLDRVHIYQFDEQGAGAVVAEKTREDLPSYLGLHFPAFDIPSESRELYRNSLVRFVPDINAEPIQIIPNGHELDLRATVLRSLDPCCTRFYQHLNSAALFVIALIKDQQLWGLISCHHQTPNWLSYDIRSACELLGKFVSLELTHKVDHEEFNHWIKLKSLQSELIESISQTQNLRDALITPAPRLLDLVSAQGAAICLDNEMTLVGATPTESEISHLLTWVEDHIRDSLFHTDALPKLYPPAEAFKQIASGVLLLRISQVQTYYVLWFRPEVLQTIEWAGNPTVSIEVAENGSLSVSPRSSFEKWQEIVQSTSLPWKSYELNSVLELRSAIVGIVLKKADELASLNLALEQSNRELDSFAFAASHDLKEPLRGIYNNSIILLEDYADRLDPEGIEGLQTTVRLSQRMEMLVNTLLRFSQLGNVELHLKPTDLNEILAETIEMLQASRPDIPFDIRIPRSLPTIECDPVLINEVFSNLVSNAFKYNTQDHPWAEVGYLTQDELATLHPPRQESTPSVFYIRDNGIGIRSHHCDLIFKLFKRLHAQEDFNGGTGAGLTISKKIVERHGGQIWVESTYREGSIFYFSLH
ncbi:MAG: GAF domain-containing protein [Leptolyngbya sp. Prado105]|jgi:light-regulated signal transduction histidine kinase (bacteriophytochrome)|nr:GAF domain-containing protein [Leptolyngbya sp. Prado105]